MLQTFPHPPTEGEMRSCAVAWDCLVVESIRLGIGAFVVQPNSGGTVTQLYNRKADDPKPIGRTCWRRRRFVVAAPVARKSADPARLLAGETVACPNHAAACHVARIAAYQWRKAVRVFVVPGKGFRVGLHNPAVPCNPNHLQTDVFQPGVSVTEPVLPDGLVLLRYEGSLLCMREDSVAEFLAA